MLSFHKWLSLVPLLNKQWTKVAELVEDQSNSFLYIISEYHIAIETDNSDSSLLNCAIKQYSDLADPDQNCTSQNARCNQKLIADFCLGRLSLVAEVIHPLRTEEFVFFILYLPVQFISA